MNDIKTRFKKYYGARRKHVKLIDDYYKKYYSGEAAYADVPKIPTENNAQIESIVDQIIDDRESNPSH